MKNYVMNVFSVVILAVIFSLLIPKGKMSKSIKGIFIFVISLVIITPFSKISYEDILNGLSLDSYEINYQNDFLDYYNDKKNKNFEKNIDEILSNFSIINANVKIEYIVNENCEYVATNVFIELKNANYNKNELQSNKTLITEKIQKLLNLEKERIAINE